LKKLTFILLVFCVITSHFTRAQTQLGFTMPPGKIQIEIPFEEYNNLIVIPVFINNFLKLKFVLDTGVETPILTEEAFARMLGIEYLREILISGPGIKDSVKAYVGQKVNFLLPGGVVGHNLNLLVLEDDYLNLSERMGTEIYGIFGYDLFKQFVVEINYDDQKLILHRPDKFKPRKKMASLPLDIVNAKPYVSSLISQNSIQDTVRLMIDTGASHSVLLDVEESSINLPAKTVPVRLGTGLAGEIPGKLGRINGFNLADLEFKKVIISIPEANAYGQVIKRGSRHGTLGGEILSRVNPTFDYKNRMIYFSKGQKFKEPFEFDMSGLSIVAKGKFLDLFVVEDVRTGSPALEADIRVGDILISVNGRGALNDNTLNEINWLLRKKYNKKMKIKILRDGQRIKKLFRLKRAI
jgi:hypothetical protein